MVKEQHICFFGKRLLLQEAGFACLVLMLTIYPVRAFAQCEQPGKAEIAGETVMGEQDAAIAALIVSVEASWTTDIDTLREGLGAKDQEDKASILAKLNGFWTEWQTALQDMTKQLSAGTSDQNRQLGSINDASNGLTSALEMQKERTKSVFAYQPTNQTCRFDTIAMYMTPARAVSDALMNGFEWDFVTSGNNEVGSLAQYGPANEQNDLWRHYTTEFCDKHAENDNAGCTSDGGVGSWWERWKGRYVDMDVLTSSLLFSQYTIDMAHTQALDAVHQMMFNVLSYQAPPPILPGSLGSPTGMAQLLARRSYIAQMDTVGALMYSVTAERAPSAPPSLSDPNTKGAPEVQDIRKSQGVEGYGLLQNLDYLLPPYLDMASPTPSQREIRQSIIEQLWNPNYYKELDDNPATIGQKELYLCGRDREYTRS